MAAGVGFGVQFLQRPVCFDRQGEALPPLEQATEQGGPGGRPGQGNGCGRVGLMQAASRFTKGCRLCGDDPEITVSGYKTDKMVAHGSPSLKWAYYWRLRTGCQVYRERYYGLR